MKIRLQVTQDCIDNGLPQLNQACPIALAVRARIKSRYARTVRVYSNILRFTRVIRRSRLPRTAKTFIRRFDHSRPVKPFSFIVDVPKSYLKAGTVGL